MKSVFLIVSLTLLLAIIPTAKAGMLKVAIIDTGIDLKDSRFKGLLCPTGHKDFTGKGLDDTNGHGTFVAGLIMQYAPAPVGNYCLLIYKFYDESLLSATTITNEISAIEEAVKNGATIINFSAGGDDFTELEYRVIADHPNVKLIVAAGNNHHNLSNSCDYFPACYNLKNIIANGSCDDKHHFSSFSNYDEFKENDKFAIKHLVKNRNDKIITYCDNGENVISTLPNDKVGFMSGTSFSTAIRTGKIIRETLNAAK